MNDIIKYEEIENLSEQEKILIINLIPNDIYINILKKNPKKYEKQISGFRIDTSSKQLQKIIPKIFLVELNKQNSIVVNLVLEALNLFIKNITDNLIKNDVNLDINYQKLSIESKNNFTEKIIKIFKTILFYDNNLINYIKLYSDLLNIPLDNDLFYDLEINLCKDNISKELYQDFQNKLLLKSVEYEKKIKKINKELNNCLKENKILNSEKQELIQENSNYKDTQKLITENTKTIKNKYENQISNLKNNLKQEEEKILNLELENKITKEDLYHKIQAEWTKENEKLVIEIAKQQEYLNKLNSKKEQLQEYLNNFLFNIDTNILDAYLKESILKSQNVTSSNVEYLNNNEIFEIQNIPMDITNNIDSLYDYICTLEDNLTKLGLSSKYMRYENDEDNLVLACYLIDLLAIDNIGIMICGNGIRELALAISMTYNSEKPHIISLPNGYQNINIINNKIKKSSSKVVLIENYQGSINDNLILNLILENKQKILLFGILDLKCIKYIPKYMFNYLSLINIDRIVPEYNNYSNDDMKTCNGFEKINNCTKSLLKNTHEDNKYILKFKSILNDLDFHQYTIGNLELFLNSISHSSIHDSYNNNLDLENRLGEYLLTEYLLIENDINILTQLYKNLMSLNSESKNIDKVILQLKDRIED